MDALEQDVPGFRSGLVSKLFAANGTEVARQRAREREALLHAMPQQWWTPNEVATRYKQLAAYASQHGADLRGVAALMRHPRLQANMWRGVRLSGGGRRWRPHRLKAHMEGIYLAHNNQTPAERDHLASRWNRTLVGRVQVLDLLFLLHFTIDHTDTFLGYTS